MKRHVQTTGVRRWAGDDLVELQGEPFRALDGFFSQYGSHIITGCEVTGNTIVPGIVGLFGTDENNNATYKIAPFAGATVVAFPVYLYLQRTAVTRLYDDGAVKPVVQQYTAELSTTIPPGVDYLSINSGGGKGFTDAIQDSMHRFTSDSQLGSINGSINNLIGRMIAVEENLFDGYRGDWTSPDQITLPTSAGKPVCEWGYITDGTMSYVLISHVYIVNPVPSVNLFYGSQTRLWSNGTLETRTAYGSDTMQWSPWVSKIPQLASNTGNSADAGKVPALQSDGLLSPIVHQETVAVGTLQNNGAVIYLNQSEAMFGAAYDKYILSMAAQPDINPNAPKIYMQAAGTTDWRKRVKLQVNLKSSVNSIVKVFVYDSYSGSSYINSSL